jgi:protein-S-isoprenylcysteine O-methyltransferase Ste14
MTSSSGAHRASRLPALGRRGGGWVLAQVALIVAVFASAVFGREWGSGYEIAAYALGATLLALGLGLLMTAAVQLGPGLTPFPTPRAGQELKTTGAFALSRHPMYGGGILIALGWTIVFASLASFIWTVVLAVFLDVKARREEAWLREQLPGYDDYCKQTQRKLLPFIH